MAKWYAITNLPPAVRPTRKVFQNTETDVEALNKLRALYPEARVWAADTRKEAREFVAMYPGALAAAHKAQQADGSAAPLTSGRMSVTNPAPSNAPRTGGDTPEPLSLGLDLDLQFKSTPAQALISMNVQWVQRFGLTPADLITIDRILACGPDDPRVEVDVEETLARGRFQRALRGKIGAIMYLRVRGAPVDPTDSSVWAEGDLVQRTTSEGPVYLLGLKYTKDAIEARMVLRADCELAVAMAHARPAT